MEAEIKVSVVLKDGLGRHVATVERTVQKAAGDNPRFFVREVMPVAQGNAEETVLTALRAWDRDRAQMHEKGDE